MTSGSTPSPNDPTVTGPAPVDFGASGWNEIETTDGSLAGLFDTAVTAHVAGDTVARGVPPDDSEDDLAALFAGPTPAEESLFPADEQIKTDGSTLTFGAAETLESAIDGRLKRFVATVPDADSPLHPPAPEPVQPPWPDTEAGPEAEAEPEMGPNEGRSRRRAGRLKEAASRATDASLEMAGSNGDAKTSALTHLQRERERLWGDVTRILSAISTESSASQQISSWKLTRDSDVYRGQRQQLETILGPLMLSQGISIGNPRDLKLVFDVVYDELIGIGPLGPLWRDDAITEILVDAWDRVTVERDGALEVTPVRFRDREHANQLARDLAASVSDRALNISNPLVTAELDRARVNFAYGPVVKSGLSISLRKFKPLLSMNGLLERGALNQPMLELLQACVAARATIVVSGGTGTGKTTMLNALSEFIPDGERVVTIEDSFELALTNLHVVSLQTKERASSDDTVRITLADLLVNSLRMRPDRIVVGEIRDPAGARAMIQAANTGHDGTMTTIHANTAQMAISDRLSDLQREATGAPDDVSKRVVASAVDLVVQVTRKHGRRFISDIAVVDRSTVAGEMIEPESIFTGDVDLDGKVSFRRAGAIRSDTGLGVKLLSSGADLATWEAT